MKKKEKPDLLENLNKIHPIFYRTYLWQYELLARRARKSGHNSMQRIIEECNFGNGTKKELEILRKEQRSRKIPDETFYPPKIRGQMGLNRLVNRSPRP